jgi:hypothetical protein
MASGDVIREFELTLVDWNEDSGETRISVVPQRGEVIKPGYSVKVGFVAEVHGNGCFNSNHASRAKDNASLLVLRLTPATLISGHAFRKLTVILTFEAAVHGDEPPDIKDYEPSFSGFFDQDTIQIKNTRAFQASLAGPTPAGLTPQASATSTREESYNIVKKLEFTTKLVAAPARPFPNCVSWEVKAKNDRDGIGDWFQVAVLLQRPKGSQFNMKVKTHASIGSIARLRSLLTPGNLGDFNKGREEVIGPLGPAPEELSSQDIPETINATDLNTARDKLWPFFKFHATEQLEATILHQKTCRRPPYIPLRAACLVPPR